MVNTKIKQTNWDLSDIIASPEGEPLKSITTELEVSISAIEAMRHKLSEDISSADFNHALELTERVTEAANRLGAYASLWFSEDTQNQDALAFQGKIEQLTTEAQNRVLFLALWWKTLPEDSADRLIANAPNNLRYYLVQQRKEKPHVLAEHDEQIINIKNMNGSNALITIYAMLTNKYKFNLATIDGNEKQELTRDALMEYVRKPDPALRERAYKELYRVYAEDGMVLAQVYKHLVQDWHEEQIKLRHYSTPIAIRNLRNNIPNEVTEILLQVCRKNAPLFQKWFSIKAGLLGMDQLRRYDIYAPLTSAEQKYPYAESVELVLDTFEQFSPELATSARRVFEDNHIDSENRIGKRGGAFCASVIPKVTPYVLLNYGSSVRDVATLAHELGHAVHSMLANNHSVLNYHSTLPLAETASTFSEMLLIDRLLENNTDAAVRQDLIANALDDNYATIMRQAYFTLFEQQAHKMIQEHAGIDELNKAYMDNIAEQFGESIDISEEFQWEWVSIPHIYYSPFYCYAYSFGQLLVLALYQRYREEGVKFIPQYLRILSYGGSQSPEYILNESGIDITKPEFWQGGFNYIEEMINELDNSATQR
ncbi:MAG: oligoendopeptidase F [Chloroflexi bacterium]|nr:oligoendopeptidase F [Chloroflexota bacterium]HCU80851.1 oligoendopeptidase F [Chloroflexota bacterium]